MGVPSRSRPFALRWATRRSVPGAPPPVSPENPFPCRVAVVLSALAQGVAPCAAERVFGSRQATITSLSHAQVGTLSSSMSAASATCTCRTSR
jgi:hypothetical protein